ncbi:hypothetical protein BASA81_001958 [Batrachochytrium salamandrivorans]|nr:hypothetical protein BASA81_001958 [Batrachochytrium salamandrivorans]
MDQEEEDREHPQASEPPPTPLPPPPQDDNGEDKPIQTKKISAKEYLQHVKNLKRRIQELEDLQQQPPPPPMRSKALGGLLSVVFAYKSRQLQSKLFHQWHSSAMDRHAQNQVERMAQLANRANGELEAAKHSNLQLSQDKLELDALNKKLRVLLQRAKTQAAEVAKQHDQSPHSEFGLKDVVRKLISPANESFVMVQLAPNKFDVKLEQVVTTWLSSREDQVGLGQIKSMEEEFSDRYAQMQHELEMHIATLQAELEVTVTEFKQFQLRAELAFEQQHSSSSSQLREQQLDAQVQALAEELVRTGTERDKAVQAWHEIKAKLDQQETLLAQAKLREQQAKLDSEALREELNALQQRQQMQTSLTLERHEEQLAKQLGDMDLEREHRRRVQAELDLLQRVGKERELEHQNQLVQLANKHQDQLALQQDKIRLLESSLSKRPALPVMMEAPTPTSTASSTRLMTTPLFPKRRISDRISQGEEEDEEEDDDSIFTESAPGSKYFVDQIGSIRSQVRGERVEWQRERAQLKQQIEDSVRRKEDGEAKIAQLERKLHEQTLDAERNQTLGQANAGGGGDGLLYLKNCVFRFITADEDSERETLLPVITMLLKFTPQEVAELRVDAKKNAPNGFVTGLLSRWS